MDLNGDDILEKVLALPVSTWRYLWEPESVTHLGPMAQDFAAAFGLGTDDKTINTVDYLGVLVVAVQALARRVDGLMEAQDAGAVHANRPAANPGRDARATGIGNDDPDQA